MKKNKKILYTLVMLVLLICTIAFQSSANVLTITCVTLTFDNLPEGFDGVTIVQLTDLHSKDFGKGNQKLLRAIRDAKPDYIFCTGDIVDRMDTDLSVPFDLLTTLSVDYPVFYSEGNHEQDNLILRDSKNLTELLRELDMTMLYNEKTTLERQGDSLDLYGFYPKREWEYKSLWNLFAPEITDAILLRDLGESDPERFTLLLAHDPNGLPKYANWGADLVLSGHIHGGLIRLPFVGGVLSPYFEFFPEYDAGEFTYGDTTLFLGRGIGGNYIPRVNNPPELVVITLKKGG